jgi:peroxiredoxin
MRWIAFAVLGIACIGCQQGHSQAPGVDARAERPPVAESAEEVRPVGQGERAPSATMQTVDGESLAMDSVYRQQPTVLVFYRGGWCPYCNTQLNDLAKIENELRDIGFQIVAVSVDQPSELRTTLAKADINYTLLSDADAGLTRAFGLAFRVDAPTIEQYAGFGIDLEAASGQKHHILPVPAVYLIDTSGLIRYAYWNADYKVRLSGAEVLEAARGFE